MENWIKENPKSDGTNYNIYQDGLKVYVTIDSKMQQYAEEAVNSHMKELQNAFDRQNIKNKKAPFRDISEEEIEQILNSAMRKSDRWRKAKSKGKDEAEIIKSFHKKIPMRVFAGVAILIPL